jgi:plastocyanin
MQTCFFRRSSRGGLLTAMISIVVCTVAGAARACITQGNAEPCHCVENMMLAITRVAETVVTPTLTSGLEAASLTGATQNIYVGDHNGNNYYSQTSATPAGNGNVTIQVGDTITWTQDVTGFANGIHNVTTFPNAPEFFDSGSDLIAPGDTFSHTFHAPGKYVYYCQLHAGYNLTGGQYVPFGTQVGTITVVSLPEPGLIGLLGAGTVLALVRRRRR